MANRSRVPQNDSVFDQYIRNTTGFLETGTPTGALRIDLTVAQADQWIAYRDQWIIIYSKYTNPALHTSTITQSKNQLKKDFTAFAEKPLLSIESSDNHTNDDRGTFKLPKRDTSPTRRGKITDLLFGKLTGIGWGMMEVRARSEQDAFRSSLHPLADGVEFKYIITDNNAGGNPTLPTPPMLGDTTTSLNKIPTPDDCPISLTSKAALWRMEPCMDNEGLRIIGFLRWVNLTNTDNNSDWSDLMTTLIS